MDHSIAPYVCSDMQMHTYAYLYIPVRTYTYLCIPTYNYTYAYLYNCFCASLEGLDWDGTFVLWALENIGIYCTKTTRVLEMAAQASSVATVAHRSHLGAPAGLEYTAASIPLWRSNVLLESALEKTVRKSWARFHSTPQLLALFCLLRAWICTGSH